MRSYVWGQDASGTLQGAGGVGGLLLINESSDSHIAGYDGNGNVAALVKTTTGTMSAAYEYDAFGNTLRATGEYSNSNPFKFSTKFADSETGFVYYGYRYYNPQVGKWISRDLIKEEGGANLYGYVLNAPTNSFDPDGLQRERAFKKVRRTDLSSPNWDSATGQMDYTYNSIILCIPRVDLYKTLDEIYTDLKELKHFEPNIATFRPNGNKGHFDLIDPDLQLLSGLAGNSIDVEFFKRPAKRELFAVTLGDHPLVGIRRWQTQPAGPVQNGSSKIAIETDAYEQANGWINQFGRATTGRDQQRLMWKTYLTNIARFWQQKFHATIVGGNPDGFIKPAGTNGNPYKSFLPEYLQHTRYRDVIEY